MHCEKRRLPRFRRHGHPAHAVMAVWHHVAAVDERGECVAATKGYGPL